MERVRRVWRWLGSISTTPERAAITTTPEQVLEEQNRIYVIKRQEELVGQFTGINKLLMEHPDEEFESFCTVKKKERLLNSLSLDSLELQEMVPSLGEIAKMQNLIKSCEIAREFWNGIAVVDDSFELGETTREFLSTLNDEQRHALRIDAKMSTDFLLEKMQQIQWFMQFSKRDAD